MEGAARIGNDTLPSTSNLFMAPMTIPGVTISRKVPLSNLFGLQFNTTDLVWPSVEHFFQAAKFDVPIHGSPSSELPRWLTAGGHCRDILEAADPTYAWTLGQNRDHAIRADWESIKVPVLYVAVRFKYNQHPSLAEELAQTTAPIQAATSTGAWQRMNTVVLERVRYELRKKRRLDPLVPDHVYNDWCAITNLPTSTIGACPCLVHVLLGDEEETITITALPNERKRRVPNMSGTTKSAKRPRLTENPLDIDMDVWTNNVKFFPLELDMDVWTNVVKFLPLEDRKSCTLLNETFRNRIVPCSPFLRRYLKITVVGLPTAQCLLRRFGKDLKGLQLLPAFESFPIRPSTAYQLLSQLDSGLTRLHIINVDSEQGYWRSWPSDNANLEWKQALEPVKSSLRVLHITPFLSPSLLMDAVLSLGKLSHFSFAITNQMAQHYVRSRRDRRQPLTADQGFMFLSCWRSLRILPNLSALTIQKSSNILTNDNVKRGLYAAIRAIPNLRSLNIPGITWFDNLHIQHNFVSDVLLQWYRLEMLSTIRVWELDFFCSVRRLLPTRDTLRLQKLCVRFEGSSSRLLRRQLGDLLDFVRSLTPGLKCLKIEVSWDCSESRPPNPAFLAESRGIRFRYLRQVQLQFHFRNAGAYGTFSYVPYIEFFRTVRRSRLMRLVPPSEFANESWDFQAVES